MNAAVHVVQGDAAVNVVGAKRCRLLPSLSDSLTSLQRYERGSQSNPAGL